MIAGPLLVPPANLLRVPLCPIQVVDEDNVNGPGTTLWDTVPTTHHCQQLVVTHSPSNSVAQDTSSLPNRLFIQAM